LLRRTKISDPERIGTRGLELSVHVVDRPIRPIANLRRKFRCLVHDSILSRNRVSGKSGAVHLNGDIKAVLWVGVAPAFAAVVLLMIAVQEPERTALDSTPRMPFTFRNALGLGRRYWLIVALGADFTLARFSEAFLVLRAQDVGLAVSFVPVVMVVMNVFYAGFAYPAGSTADRFSRRTLLLGGLVVLIVADMVLATAASIGMVLLGAALWGLHMALTQGLFAKLVADAAPVELRGTAFGVFNLLTGVAVLLASVIAGALWSTLGPSATFLAGAAFAAVAALGLLVYRTPRTAE